MAPAAAWMSHAAAIRSRAERPKASYPPALRPIAMWRCVMSDRWANIPDDERHPPIEEPDHG